MKNEKCCSGPVIVVKLFLLAGIYILTWGLIGSSSGWEVLSSPIFWGLFLIFAAFGIMKATHKK